MSTETHYDVLGVSATASPAEIDRAFRRLARLTHPDVGGTASLFRRVNEAHRALADPATRAAYDAAVAPPTRRSPTRPSPGRPSSRPAQPRSAPPTAARTGPRHAAAGSTTRPGPSPASGPSRRVPRWAGVGDWTRRRAVDGGVRARRFLAFHPWVLPLALGAAVLAVSVPLAVAVLAVGVTALIGARPTSDRLRLRHADLDQVDRMDGTTFELYLSELLRDHGYGVRHVGRVGDFGADLLIDADGQRAVVQAKRYRQAVGVNAVREAAAARAHYGAQRAIVVTNSWFTGPAVALARSNRVDLWNRETLATLAAGAPHRDAPSGAALLGRELVEGAWLLVKLLGVMVLAAAAGNVRRRRRQRRT